MNTTRVLVTSDWHVPFFDPEALSRLFYQIQTRKPNWIILNGDLIDFYPISTHLRSPARLLSLQEELDTLVVLLQIVRDLAPRARITYMLGNHEERFIKYLWRDRPELLPLRSLSLPTLLGLNRFRIELHPFPFRYLTDECTVTHGNITRKRSGYTAHGMMELFGAVSGVSGYVHRLARVHKRFPSGKIITWVEGGCACQLQASYAPAPDWQHGFAWIDIGSEPKSLSLEAVLLYAGLLKFKQALPSAEPAVLITSDGLQERTYGSTDQLPD